MAGIIFSSPYFIPPLYESRVVMFATSSNSIDKSIEDQYFGYDIDADRLLQILESESLRDSVINRFNLAAHYKIDTLSGAWRHTLIRRYQGNVSFERTRYMSVVIKVLDEDPLKAADIANGIASLVDEIRNKVLKINASASKEASRNEYLNKLEMVEKIQQQVDSLKFGNKKRVLTLQGTYFNQKSNKIQELRKELNDLRARHNIFDFGFQINILNEALAEAKAKYLNEAGKFRIYDAAYTKNDTIWINTKARMEGAKDEMEQFEKELEYLTKINKQYLSLTDQLAVEVKLSAHAQQEYEKNLASFEPEFMNSELQKLNTVYASELYMLGELRKKYDRAYQNFHKPLPSTYIMNKAQPSWEKKYPVRSVFLLISVIAGVALTFIVILLVEKTIHFNAYIRNHKNL